MKPLPAPGLHDSSLVRRRTGQPRRRHGCKRTAQVRGLPADHPGPSPRERNPRTTTNTPTTRNVLYVLQNGQPNEWALCRDVPVGEAEVDGVAVWRFDGVPDELCDAIANHGKPSHVWEDLVRQSESFEAL